MKNFDESRKRYEEEDLTAEEVVQSERNRDTERSERDADVLPFRPSGQRNVNLLGRSESEEMRNRWNAIQNAFVDDPQTAVQDADQLVQSAIQRLSEVFAEERSKLESQWSREEDISTEDRRVAFQRYRAFFDRLLSI